MTEVTPHPLKTQGFHHFLILLFYDHPAEFPACFFRGFLHPAGEMCYTEHDFEHTEASMFTGFTDETVDFMWGIRFNNERTWFEAHKEIYLTHLYQPMKELGSELYDFLRQKRPDGDLMCKVSRIYRDARRLHGRGPYKESLWFSVEQPSEMWTAHPTFWFELMPEGWSYGMGYYMAKPLTMAKLRARMDRDPKPMEKLTRALNGQTEFVLETADYKKPRSQPASDLLAPWYRAKSFAICHNDKLTDELFSRDIVDRLKTGFEFLLPYYDYFVTLDGDPDPREL